MIVLECIATINMATFEQGCLLGITVVRFTVRVYRHCCGVSKPYRLFPLTPISAGPRYRHTATGGPLSSDE